MSNALPMGELLRRREALRQAVQGRGTVLGGWICFAHTSIAEIIARSGVDFLGIDMEHTPISLDQARDIIVASHLGGTLCLPRIPAHDPAVIKRLLDSGADGIIAPTVETAEQARALASWCAYPPLGVRGFGVNRAQGYGFDFESYVSGWNDSFTCIAQVETVRGMENVEAILAVEGIHGIMIGPYDLSGSLGLPGQLDHPRVLEAESTILKACHNAGKGCGMHVVDPDPETVARRLGQGFTWLVLGADVFALRRWSADLGGLVAQARNTACPQDNINASSRNISE